MKTRAKKILKNVVSAIIIVCMISQSVVTAFATQNRTGNFSKSYSLSGNGATDIVRVAAAQLGRTGSQLGYSEQWCADFVSDCAILANQSAAIPAAGYCPTLRQNIINAGGQYVSKANAKAGDIVFYGNNGADHVEIVYAASNGNVSTYGGNSGSEGSLYSRKVKQHATQTMSIAYIVRPNYSGAASSGCNCSTSYAGTYIVNTSQYPLTMRSGHGTGYSAVTTIPKGTEVTVTKGDGTWAHVEWNGYSGYCAMEYLKKKETDREIEIHVWVSDDKMGSTPSEFYTGNRYYLCYEIRYKDTKERIGYAKNYTVTEQFTLPNGQTTDTCTYNNDNNWYSIGCVSEGNYKGTITVSGDLNGTIVADFDVKIKDDEKPVIKNVKVSDVSPTGYTVSCEVTDNVGVDRVQFPTWTVKNDQDDIQSNWVTSSAASGTKSGNTYTYRVNISDHNNERGQYLTHIYAYDKSGNVTADSSVKVDVPEPNKPVSGVKLTDESSNNFIAAYMKSGDAIKMKADVQPENASNKNIIWKSEDSSVATVDSTGKITAKNSGTTKITVSTEDGNYSDSCIIKVGTKVHYGDIDNDNRVTASDYSELKEILDGTVNAPGEDVKERCDLDKSYRIEDNDLKLLGQFVNGEIEVFPAESYPYEIYVTKAPYKLDYKVGESVDTSGIQLKLVYGNGKTKEVSEFSLEYDFSMPGKRRVILIYSENGRKCTGYYFVNVSEEETTTEKATETTTQRPTETTTEKPTETTTQRPTETTTERPTEPATQEPTEPETQEPETEQPTEIKKYIVKFVDGDRIIDTQRVSEGMSAVEPEITKTGYTLYWDDDFDEVYENMIINAEWVANDYKVKFNAAGGRVYEKSMEVTYDEEYGEMPEAERSGYLFDGWYTKKNGGEEISEFTVMNTAGTHTLYAHWEKVTVPKISIRYLSSLRKGMSVAMNAGKGEDGCQIMYSTNKNFRSYKKINTSDNVENIKKLKSRTKYYVKVRGYVYDSKCKKVYGAWSKVNTIIVK